MYRRLFLLVVVLVLLLGIGTLVSAQDEGEVDLTPPELGSFDPATVQDIDLESYPILPELTDFAREIFAKGQSSGRSANIFSKVGDCMTATVEYFLGPFASDDFDLGDYADLQAVLDHFGGTPAREGDWQDDSFATMGLASASGFNTASILDSIWSDPEWCGADESPLTCEYRVANPAFALIMFGTNDVIYIDAASFDYYLRSIVLETINADIVPILSTFPPRPDRPDETILFNQIVVKIAEDYQVPLVNLWLAVKDLPDQGVDPVQPIHLSIPPDEKTGDFVTNLEYGYTMRNLLTLQMFQKFLADLEVN